MKNNALLIYKNEVKDGRQIQGHVWWTKRWFVSWRVSLNEQLKKMKSEHGENFIIVNFIVF